MSVFDNIDDFIEEEIPSPEKLNALRDAMIQAFSGNIGASNVSWPLIAQGALDMNNNPLLNVGNLNNVIHVNDTKSLAEAIADVNAAGGGYIVIDPEADASTTASGVAITANNVVIAGGGGSSIINLDDGVPDAITVSGSNVIFYNVNFQFPSSPVVLDTAIYFSGTTRPIVSHCVFAGSGAGTAIKLGSAVSNTEWALVQATQFYGLEVGVHSFRSWGAQINACVFQELVGSPMTHILLSGAVNSFAYGIVVDGNVFYSESGSPDPAISAVYAGGVPALHQTANISNNYFYVPSGNAVECSGFDYMVINNNVLNAGMSFGSNDGTIVGNSFVRATSTLVFAGATRVLFTGNTVFPEVTFSGTNDELVFNSNRFENDFTFTGADSGVRAFFSNSIGGNLTIGVALLAGNDFEFGMNRVEGGVV